MNAPSDRPDHAGELRRELVDVRAVLEQLGLKAKREGAGFKVLCPWHDEKTASCMVRLGPDRTIQAKCHAHGCDRGGDVLSFIAAVRGLSTKGPDFQRVLLEAAHLARRHNIIDDLEGRVPAERRAPAPRPAPRPSSSTTAEKTYAPTGELVALWDASGPTEADEEASTWLRSRALDPSAVDAYDLARALPAEGLPRWARYRGEREKSEPWSATGHRCLLPLFDAEGAFRGMRARLVRPGADPKALPPSGHVVVGLVLADRTARAMLATGKLPGGRLVIVEGEPDFLTWATRVSDADETPFGVLGIPGSGSWTDALAARIPDGARVALRVHADPAGEKYAAAVTAAIAGRCDVRRWR